MQVLSSQGQLFTKASACFDFHPVLNVDYTATAPHLDLLTPYGSALDQLGVASAQWDPRTGPPPGGLAGGADLVMCNHAWGPLLSDAKTLVQNMVTAAKATGFILTHVLLKGFPLGDTVSFLEDTDRSSAQPGVLTQVTNRLEPLNICF